MACLSGCQRPILDSEPPVFPTLYERLVESLVVEEEPEPVLARLSLSAQDMPFSTFARVVSDRTGVSIVADASLDERPVTIDVVDEDVASVLGVVARRVGVQVTRSGTLFFLGDLRPEDRGVFVRKVDRLARDELTAAISVLLSENGRVATYPDGLVVVGDRVEVIGRVREMLDAIEAAPADSWVVQLHLIAMRSTDAVRFGFDVQPSAEIAATFAQVSGGNNNEGRLSVTAAFDAVLQAEATVETVRVLTDPMFVLLDGETARFADGDRVPIITPNFQEGVQVGESVEFLQTGIEVNVAVRDLGTSRALLDLDVSVSDVVGFVGNQPVVNEQAFDTRASVASSGVYLLGSLRRGTTTNATRGPLQVDYERSEADQLVQVWARTYRIATPRPSHIQAEASAGPRVAQAERVDDVPPSLAWTGNPEKDRKTAELLAVQDGRPDDQNYIEWLLSQAPGPADSGPVE